MSRSDTWMPLYIGDYLRDTNRLSTVQHGAYFLLIMDYWVNGPPPDDDEQLAAVTKSSAPEWKKLRQALVRYFQIEDGFWRHKRVDKELAKTTKITEQNRNAGLASAAAKAQRKVNGRSTDVATEPATEGQQNLQRNATPSQSPSPESEDSPSVAARKGGIDGEALAKLGDACLEALGGDKRTFGSAGESYAPLVKFLGVHPAEQIVALAKLMAGRDGYKLPRNPIAYFAKSLPEMLARREAEVVVPITKTGAAAEREQFRERVMGWLRSSEIWGRMRNQWGAPPDEPEARDFQIPRAVMDEFADEIAEAIRGRRRAAE